MYNIFSHPEPKLIILHYHLRPCGVRRVIELATPAISKHFTSSTPEIILATGEAPPDSWFDCFKTLLPDISVNLFIAKCLGYYSEQDKTSEEIRAEIQGTLNRLFDGCNSQNTILWFHNPGIGRNLILNAEVIKIVSKRQIPTLFHHHDWWFDNRWQRFQEMKKCGFKNLDAIANAIIPINSSIKNATINSSDYSELSNYGDQAVYIPNPINLSDNISKKEIDTAKNYLNDCASERAPVWIMPSRVLRRKNIAEALLLKLILKPDAWLFITAGASSEYEIAYSEKLLELSQDKKLKFKIGILNNTNKPHPPVHAFLRASDVVLLTSLQEGFGLPYIEAAQAECPLIARELPNIKDDLAKLGFKFKYYYKDIFIPPNLFVWKNEYARQYELFKQWTSLIPVSLRQYVNKNYILKNPESPAPVPFSQLTINAQLEVLSNPIPELQRQCLMFNPFLVKWKKLIQDSNLQNTTLPKKAISALDVTSFAKKFWEIVLKKNIDTLEPSLPSTTQLHFIKKKLSNESFYPLLWGQS